MSEWGPAIAVLALGGIAALIALLANRRRVPVEAAVDDERAAAELRAQQSIDALHELMADKHALSAEHFAAEKARLELQAAAALRERDQRKSQKKSATATSTVTTTATTWGQRHPQLVGALWGGGAVALVSALFNFALMDAKPRMGIGGVEEVTAGDQRYEALLVLAAIAIESESSEQILQSWAFYMKQQPPRRRPPMFARALQWLEENSGK
jgi:hypothetical protein